MSKNTNLLAIPTYVYIDTSNIRNACLRSCKFVLDFKKLYRYLDGRYPNLREIRYYEGISYGDNKKQEYFTNLRKTGYKICALRRKKYIEPAIHDQFICKRCGAPNTVQILPQQIKLKSNVDVYLASDMLERAVRTRSPIHLILFSCDGDYAEAIKAALRINPKAFITIVATPKTRKNNCLSSRLQQFASRDSDHTALVNIENIKDRISRPLLTK